MKNIDERKSITWELIETIKDSDVINKLGITPKDIRIGVFYTGIVLSTGHAGMSYTPVQEIPEAVCCPRSHAKMPSAGTLLDFQLTDLMNYALDDNALKAAVGIATINALSAILLEDETCQYKPSAYGNALDLVKITSEDSVAMVGAFPPFIKSIQEIAKKLFVIEKNPRIVGKGDMVAIEPEVRLKEIIPQANILVITGVTLVNHTLGPILQLARRESEIVVVGPTASVYPEPLFKRGVTVLGGVRISDAAKMIHLIGEAGSGYDFFGNCAEKIVIRNEASPIR
ncbi:MAG: Rossmann-like domain-containing protein [Candidatus Scalinduaceae bacterium]